MCDVLLLNHVSDSQPRFYNVNLTATYVTLFIVRTLRVPKEELFAAQHSANYSIEAIGIFVL